MEIVAHHRHHGVPSSDLLIQSAQAVANRMGRLHVLLKPTMDAMCVTVPWDESGPPVVRLLDLRYERAFKKAFESMAHIERMAASE